MQGFGQPAAPAAPGANPAPAAPKGGFGAPEIPKGTPATPEQQKEYNRFVGHARLMLSDEAFIPKATKMLFSSKQNDVESIARLTLAIGSRIYQKAKEQRKPISEAVLLHGGYEIAQLVTEFAMVAGVPGAGPEDAEPAFYMAADMFRKQLEGSGEIDKDLMSQQSQDIQNQYGADMLNTAREKLETAVARRRKGPLS